MAARRLAPRLPIPRPRWSDVPWLGILAVGLLAVALGAADWWLAGGPAAATRWPLAIPLVLGGAMVTTGVLAGRLARQQAHHELATSEHQARLDALLTVGVRLSEASDRKAILWTIAAELHRVLAVDAVTVRLVEGEELRLVAWAGIGDETAARLPRLRADEGWFAELVRRGSLWAREEIRRQPLPGDMADRYADILPAAADLVVPIHQGDRIVGALVACSFRPRRWRRADLGFAAALAGHTRIALTQWDLVEETRRRNAQLMVLQAAAARMSREGSLESIGRAIVEETRRIIDYHNARVYVLEPPDELVPVAFEGRVGAYAQIDPQLLRTRLGVGLTGWVGQHGEPLLVDDANADPRSRLIPGTDPVDESMLVVPMRYERQVLGVITLSKLGLGQFGPDDLRLLTIMADQAATAIHSTRLLARAQGLADELRRILAVSRALAQSLDPRDVAELTAFQLGDALGADACVISRYDVPDDAVVTLGFFPPTLDERVGAVYPLGDYPETRRVLDGPEIVLVHTEDPAADPAEVALMKRHGWQSGLLLPLVAKGRSIGLVELFWARRTQPSPAHLEFAQTLANEAGAALENARLYEEARRLADHDPLTGFLNHRAFHERLGQELVRADRQREAVSLLMLDLDGFKQVNDRFGHQLGDQVLAWAARTIAGCLRASDVPARYGGDEFAVVLPSTDAEGAEAVARRIRDAFAEATFDGGTRGPIPVGVSVGRATHPADGRTIAQLVAAADAALYRTKAARTAAPA